MFPLVSSADNETYRKVKKLKQKKYRLREGRYILEGTKPILEALEMGIRPDLLYVRQDSPGLAQGWPGKEHADYITLLTSKLFDELSSTQSPQDLIMVGKRKMHALDELVTLEDVLILDGLQDPGNMGTIVRTSIASGLRHIILTQGSLDPYNPKTLRATAGAFFKASFYLAEEIEDLLHRLSFLDKQLVCADAQGSVSLFDLHKDRAQALVVGNEHQGPSDELRKASEQMISIPMPGEIESLNVAVATSLLLYEMLRKRGD